MHLSLSCVGDGNGNPLQGSCLETPRDGGAWWAAVERVAQSRTRLKRLSSSSILSQTPLLSRLQRNIEQSSLRRAIGPCWLYLLFIKKNLFYTLKKIHSFLATLDHCFVCALSSCSEWGARTSHCCGVSCCRVRAMGPGGL